MSFDTLCREIGDGAKAHKSFEADNDEADSSSQQAVIPSTKHSPEIVGVYFNDLDYSAFNPMHDPGPGSCYNCWEQGHSRKECPKQKLQDFCYNCGRRDVRVTTCPRCSRAYVSYSRKKSRKESRRPSGEFYDDVDKLFKMEENKNGDGEPECLMQSVGNDEDECFSSTENRYYEDVVVDEDKRSLKFTGKFLEDFLNLLDAMKHLPIDTQNTIILRFVEDRRELMKEEGMVIIKIPSFSKMWDFCQALLNNFYKFIRDFILNFM